MVRYKLILAYDGTQFAGFQRQANVRGDRTVQGEVEFALRQLGWQGSSILAAGRTDRGVHASCQVIAFDLDWRHPMDELQAALNAYLPSDMAVSAVETAKDDFHPRYRASARRYRYRIYCQPWRDPLRDRYAWRVWPPVQLERLQAIAGRLVGSRDFAAFGTPPRAGGSTVRTVHTSWWQCDGEDLIYEIVANAFLYHMVRRLVYAQVVVAQGILAEQEVFDRLEGTNRTMLQGIAPPQGLVLAEVIYSDEAAWLSRK